MGLQCIKGSGRLCAMIMQQSNGSVDVLKHPRKHLYIYARPHLQIFLPFLGYDVAQQPTYL